MKSISFAGKNLNDGTIVTSNIQFEDAQRNLVIQEFSVRDGGKVLGEQFKPRTISWTGYISGSSREDMEERIDDLKKELLNSMEGDLLIQYRDGVRRFICTCMAINPVRASHTIDKIDITMTFQISNPPYGKDLTYSSFFEPNISFSTATITSKNYTGTVVFGGSRAPFTNIIITINSCTSCNSIAMKITNANGFSTTTTISQTFSTGDIIQIDKDTGQVTVNNDKVDFTGGFPKYTLSNNSYVFTVSGDAYDIDIKFKYYKLWL